MSVNGMTFSGLEALYYESIDKIPDSDECVRARNEVRKLAEKGDSAWEDEALSALESANQKQGFVYGFRLAARMSDLLSKGAADV